MFMNEGAPGFRIALTESLIGSERVQVLREFFDIATRRVFEPTEKLFPLLPVAGLLIEF